jgi:LysM repeat protein
VKASDTLRRIARRFGVTVDQLLAVNDLGDPPTITPGQSINIPRPAPAP